MDAQANSANETTDVSPTGRESIRTTTMKIFLLVEQKDLDGDGLQATRTKLQTVTDTLPIFTDADEFVDVLTDDESEPAMLFIASTLVEPIVPLIHDIPHLHVIFVAGRDTARHEQWHKVKSVSTDVGCLEDEVTRTARRWEHNAVSISLLNTSGELSEKKLDKLDCAFMYTQILKESLLEIEYDNEQLQRFVDSCRQQCAGNAIRLAKVATFANTYRGENSIWWYTVSELLYPVLNRALRTLDTPTIVDMAFFLRDLHNNIARLHRQQFADEASTRAFTVYRGQCISRTEFSRLMDAKGGLLAFNSFLSTSRDRRVSELYQGGSTVDPNVVDVLFVMHIDPLESTAPFASIEGITQYKDESEVLFSMHTIFRVREITPRDAAGNSYQVDLTLTTDNDNDLRVLTERVRKDLKGSREWHAVGAMMIALGHYGKAEEIYRMLFDRSTLPHEQAFIHKQFGVVKLARGQYHQAIECFQRALALFMDSNPDDRVSLAAVHQNMATVFTELNDLPRALYHCKKYVGICEEALSPHDLDLATAYHSIGDLYARQREYATAKAYKEKSIAIRRQTLPPSHPLWAQSHQTIGHFYTEMGEPEKALAHFEEALKIMEDSLPVDHPHLRSLYNNLGVTYISICDHHKALPYLNKALELHEKAFGSAAHPDQAYCYNNLGAAHSGLGDCETALRYHWKSLEVRQQLLPPNHPYLADSYNNIGFECARIPGEKQQALSYFEKALAIQRESLPARHLNFASTHENIGKFYHLNEDFDRALSHYIEAIDIRKKELHADHPLLATLYNNVGALCGQMENYEAALSYLEQALRIQLQAPTPDRQLLSDICLNTGHAHKCLGHVGEALQFYIKAQQLE